MSDQTKGRERLIAEAREHLAPPTHGADHDWRAADDALFARLEAEKGKNAPPLRLVSAPRRAEIWGGLALAAAAAAVLVWKPFSEPVAQPHPAPVPIVAGTRELGEGARVFAAAGSERTGTEAMRLFAGDRIETTSAVGYVSLSEAGTQAVAWRIESESRLVVSQVRAPLGLALEHGAVEADVTPVKQGEAFVVDVGPVRVAVRGTHLRVERQGSRAIVDLSEGTIAVGNIPEAGITQGHVVSAPAHVEIDLASEPVVRVARTRESVRTPTFEHDVRVAAVTPPPPVDPAPPQTPPRAPSGSNGKPAPIPDLRSPRSIITDTVRECIEKLTPPSSSVKVTVNTTLSLDIDQKGRVTASRFEPPVSADVEVCAAQTISDAHFSAVPGTERIKFNVVR